MKGMHTTNLRFGHVTAYDPSRHMARVHFPDLKLTSYWLPVLVSNSLKNHDYSPLDIGEHVACMMSGNGAEMGIVLGAFYDDKNTPPMTDGDIRSVVFEDGSRVYYDRRSGTLFVEAVSDVNVKAEHIELTADRIDMNAEEIEIHGEELVRLKGRKIRAKTDDWGLEEL